VEKKHLNSMEDVKCYKQTHPSFLKQGNFCGLVFNPSLKIGVSLLFVATHSNQKEHGG
jgi:hypothetical protein